MFANAAPCCDWVGRLAIGGLAGRHGTASHSNSGNVWNRPAVFRVFRVSAEIQVGHEPVVDPRTVRGDVAAIMVG